ncbi:MAG: class I SAM-dependent methyltransferase [Actinomycetota bacterium]
MTDIEQLPPATNVVEPEPFAGPDHPMRKVTRGVAFENAWSAERATKVGELFDSMAADWSETHVDDVKAAPIADAIERGGLPLDGSWLDLGTGTGAGMRVLAPHVARLVAVDLSFQMLSHAPAVAPRAQGDASALPFADATFDGILAVNMLLFPAELDRILAPGGVLVWVNSLGDQTPIHLPPADVATALPGTWAGRTAQAGSGFWAALRRTESSTRS